MKILSFVLASLCIVSVVSAQTYTTEEFIVTGDRVTTPGPLTPQAPVTTALPAGVYVTETPNIYVGMSKNLLLETMGEPIQTEKFRKTHARKQGIYDEILTYPTPAGVTYVFIKERRVMKIQER